MSENEVYCCKEAFKRIDDYLDRELTPAEMELVKNHLEACAHCASEFKFEGDVIQSLKEKLLHIDLPCDLLEKIRSALDRA